MLEKTNSSENVLKRLLREFVNVFKNDFQRSKEAHFLISINPQQLTTSNSNDSQDNSYSKPL